MGENEDQPFDQPQDQTNDKKKKIKVESEEKEIPKDSYKSPDNKDKKANDV